MLNKKTGGTGRTGRQSYCNLFLYIMIYVFACAHIHCVFLCSDCKLQHQCLCPVCYQIWGKFTLQQPHSNLFSKMLHLPNAPVTAHPARKQRSNHCLTKNNQAGHSNDYPASYLLTTAVVNVINFRLKPQEVSILYGHYFAFLVGQDSYSIFSCICQCSSHGR